jgi:hypothetical protein
MPRGGRHENTLKPNWESGKTCTIRIPESRKKQILAFAKTLDKVEGKWSAVDAENYQAAVNLLRESLEFPLNNGSRYRNSVMAALDLLDEEYVNDKRQSPRSTRKVAPISRDS